MAEMHLDFEYRLQLHSNGTNLEVRCNQHPDIIFCFNILEVEKMAQIVSNLDRQGWKKLHDY